MPKMYYATAKEMERLDKLAVENGLEIRQMMELAGWHMVSLFETLRISKLSSVVVMVGKGNKGGDGLSAARHLANHGWDVSVILLSETISADSRHHLGLLKKMRVPTMIYENNKSKARWVIEHSTVLIDALIGYHLDGPPRGLFKEVIELMNKSGKKIIAYDLPSGIDATTGECLHPCIQARATLSLALPKRAFKVKKSTVACGKIFLADIGIPNFLYDRIHGGSRPHSFLLSIPKRFQKFSEAR